MPDFGQQRQRMVEEQLVARNIVDRRLLSAFAKVPRERFVAPSLRQSAYDDCPLSIGFEQTISQPYIVALMAEALRIGASDRVLEIGTGSGYAAVIFAQLAAAVYSVERVEGLARAARAHLATLGVVTVQVRVGDGSLGWPEQAPFDAIAVAAAGPGLPTSLLEQLAIGGRLIMPVGPEGGNQQLVRVTREGKTRFGKEQLLDVRFVPLIGEQAYGVAGGAAVTCAPD
jgi:protein-L-isoaspartate(D-aspartate) O-methyltransferase